MTSIFSRFCPGFGVAVLMLLVCVRAGTIANAAPVIFYVSAETGLDTHDGTNGWGDAFLTIGYAVSKTHEDDIVLVSNGTYQIASQITITNGITVQSLNGPDVTVVRGPGTLDGQTDAHRCFSITHVGATVNGFTITNGYAFNNGGGVYMTGGTLRNCKIVGNRSHGTWGDASLNGGGGVQLAGAGPGSLRNCLIAGNHVDDLGYDSSGGGGIHVIGSGTWRIENCTIARNFAGGNTSKAASGGILRYGGTVTLTNCIVYQNFTTRGDVGVMNWYGVSMSYSCTTPTNGLTGPGNTGLEPNFIDFGENYGLSWTGGDLRLGSASLCVDKGVSMAASFTDDLVGTIRPQDGDGNGTAEWDMGAYELPGGIRPFDFTFMADRVAGFTPLPVAFSVTVAGSDTNQLGFTWDFGNGVTNSGFDLFAVTNIYTTGDYIARLTVTNGSGESVTKALVVPQPVIRVSPTTVYVATNGLQQAPYDRWDRAASNIQTAVDWGYAENGTGTVVVVSNGVYALTSQISISKGLTVRSVNGAAVTTINGRGSVRGFYISNSGALVDGFTITNGYNGDNGGGVYMTGGALWNCKIVGNRSHGSNGDASQFGGGGVQLAGAGPGSLRNCLIAGNSVDDLGHDSATGGGIHVKGTGTWRIENCTIARNFAGGNNGHHSAGAGIHRIGGTVTLTNCIVFQNFATRGDVGTTNWFGVMNMSYSCTTPTNGLSGAGNTSADPGFIQTGADYGLSWTGGDLHLGSASPCVNTGTNLSWMGIATDLDGLSREVGRSVDMGAYEQPPKGSVIMIL